MNTGLRLILIFIGAVALIFDAMLLFVGWKIITSIGVLLLSIFLWFFLMGLWSKTSFTSWVGAALTMGIAIIISLMILVKLPNSLKSEVIETHQTEKVEKKVKTDEEGNAACKLDLQCWGDKNSVFVGKCKGYVEKLAKYNARWTDGTFETKFSNFKWLNQEKATLTYIGDKVEFQNGFGAYQTHLYECDYDPASNTVLDVRAWPGRL